MDGRPAAPEVIVIYKIVVDECPGVEQLHRGGGGHGGVFIAPNGSARPEQHRRAKPFSRAFQIGKYSVAQVLRLEPLAKSRLTEAVVYLALAFSKGFIKIKSHIASYQTPIYPSERASVKGKEQQSKRI
jgi:hypothetical protein